MSDIYRLAKPRKKGLLSLVFSRFFIILLLIVLQVAMYIAIYGWLKSWMPFFTALILVFTVGGVVYLFNSDMDASAKLTWMFIIAIMPIAGVIFLYFTKTNLGNRLLTRRVDALIRQTRDAIDQPEGVLEALEDDGSGTDDLIQYLNRSGCFPAYKSTEVTYYPTGEEKFAALIEALKGARKFIFMEYFIVEEGYMWGSILEVLVEKAAEGVDVRVMYDGMCEISLLPSNYCELLNAKGIHARAYSPIKPVVSSHYNYRDHRKIAVIDGEVAFNGGVNLADEYINHRVRFGHWKDTAVMLRGDAVRSFTLLFLQMWNIMEEEPRFEPWISEGGRAAEHPSGYVIPYGTCPLNGQHVGEMVYMDMLNRATDYVHIMTPYLILDDALETALRYAAERGVEVKLILPGIPDKPAAYALGKSHYRRLVASGVRIYEYTPGFVHAKVFVSDDVKAVVGTINLDYRSLYHHFECATYLYKTACIPDIERDFQQTLAKCREVTDETIRNRKRFIKEARHLLEAEGDALILAGYIYWGLLAMMDRREWPKATLSPEAVGAAKVVKLAAARKAFEIQSATEAEFRRVDEWLRGEIDALDKDSSTYADDVAAFEAQAAAWKGEITALGSEMRALVNGLAQQPATVVEKRLKEFQQLEARANALASQMDTAMAKARAVEDQNVQLVRGGATDAPEIVAKAFEATYQSQALDRAAINEQVNFAAQTAADAYSKAYTKAMEKATSKERLEALDLAKQVYEDTIGGIEEQREKSLKAVDDSYTAALQALFAGLARRNPEIEAQLRSVWSDLNFAQELQAAFDSGDWRSFGFSPAAKARIEQALGDSFDSLVTMQSSAGRTLADQKLSGLWMEIQNGLAAGIEGMDLGSVGLAFQNMLEAGLLDGTDIDVSELEGKLFYSCFGVAEYHLKPDHPPTFNSTSLSNISADCTIYVPYSDNHSILAAYKRASGWMDYANKIVEEQGA